MNSLSLHKFTLDKLKELNLHPQKYNGQNFLVSERVLVRIINEAYLERNETVIEIGAGLGTLTEQLTKNVKKVIAYEKDKILFNFLKERFNNKKNLLLINDDFLKTNLNNLKINSKLKIVSNLPYSVASQILFKIIEWDFPVCLCIFMLQREVADRIVSSVHTKNYGILSVFLQLYGKCEVVVNFSPKSFLPKPEVYSSLLKIHPYNNKTYNLLNDEPLKKIVKSAFQQRRKKCYNSIGNVLNLDIETIKKMFLNANIGLESRAEDIKPLEFVRLTKEFQKAGIF